MKLPSFRNYAFIFILPCLGLAITLIYRSAAGPFWMFWDPTYVYFFSAIQMFKSITPTFIDHPGAPLQALIFIIIWFFNIGHSTSQTIDRVLTDPEFYLQVTNVFLMVSLFLSSVLLGGYAFYKTKDKIAAILTQLPVIFLLNMREMWHGSVVVASVNTENLIFSITNLFILFILALFYAENNFKKFLAVLFLGIIAGIGITTQFYFCMLILLAFILIPRHLRIIFILTFLSSSLLVTFPIISKLPLMLKILTGILIHTGYYGAGREGFIDWNYTWTIIKINLWPGYWFFLCSSLYMLIWSLIKINKEPKDRGVRYLTIVTSCIFLYFFMVLKQWGDRYLIPGIQIFGLALFFFYLSRMAPYQRLKKWVIVFIIIFVLASLGQTYQRYTELHSFTKNILDFHQKVETKYPNCTFISDDYYNQNYAMLFSNSYTFHHMDQELTRLYPKSFYFINEKRDSIDLQRSYYDGFGIWNARQRIFADDLLSTSPCVIFLKRYSDPIEGQYNAVLLEKSEYLKAYLLTSSTEKQAREYFINARDLFVKGEYAEALIPALKSKVLNFEPSQEIDFLLLNLYQHLHH